MEAFSHMIDTTWMNKDDRGMTFSEEMAELDQPFWKKENIPDLQNIDKGTIPISGEMQGFNSLPPGSPIGSFLNFGDGTKQKKKKYLTSSSGSGDEDDFDDNDDFDDSDDSDDSDENEDFDDVPISSIFAPVATSSPAPFSFASTPAPATSTPAPAPAPSPFSFASTPAPATSAPAPAPSPFSFASTPAPATSAPAPFGFPPISSTPAPATSTPLFSFATASSKLTSNQKGGLVIPSYAGMFSGATTQMQSFYQQQNIGKTKLVPLGKGLKSITFSGFLVSDVLYSLTRYIQTGYIDKSKDCVVEIYNISKLSDKTAKEPLKQLYITLMTSAAADISPKHFGVSIPIINTILNYSGLYKAGTGKTNPTLGELFYIVELLCKAEKTAIVRQCAQLYYNGDTAQSLINMKSPLIHGVEPRREDFVEDDIYRIVVSIFSEFGIKDFSSNDMNNAKLYAVLFTRRLISLDLSCITFWKYFEISNIQLAGKKTKNAHVEIMFTILKKLTSPPNSGNNGMINVFQTAYLKGLDETREYYAIAPIILTMFGKVDELGLTSPLNASAITAMNTSEDTRSRSASRDLGISYLNDVIARHSQATRNFNLRYQNIDPTAVIPQLNEAYSRLTPPEVVVKTPGRKPAGEKAKSKKSSSSSFLDFSKK